MNRPGTARKDVVWYPATSDCPVFACFSKRSVERLLKIAVKRYENTKLIPRRAERQEESGSRFGRVQPRSQFKAGQTACGDNCRNQVIVLPALQRRHITPA